MNKNLHKEEIVLFFLNGVCRHEQAEAWKKQLEKGEVVEMKARVGGAE